ncbi:MAG: HAD superfamily hydrolase (TIGR01549 family) [Polyangiales bacterium]
MKRRALLLDAGNTVVFLDHAAVAETVGGDEDAIRAAERVAKDTYAQLLKEGATHENGWRVFMKTLLSTAGVEGELEAHVDALEKAHEEFNFWRRVPAELSSALDDARAAGWVPAIVSNSEGRLVELFDRVGLEDAFEVIVDSAHVGIRKPDPRIFEIALKALGIKAEDAIYAGDIPDVDVQGARAAGVRAFLIDPHDDFPDYDEAPRFSSVRDLVTSLLSEANEEAE